MIRKLKESIKVRGHVVSEDCSDKTFKTGESIKIKRFYESTVTDLKDRTILLEHVNLSMRENNLVDDDRKENEKTIPLERSEILKKN